MTDPMFEAKSSRPLWILAAVVAVGLHIGGAALALANLRPDDGDDGLGANGAEYAVEMTSPKLPETDLPAGQDSAASQYQPQQMQQQAEVKETDLPKDVPQETEDPDRLVTENDSKKPVEENTKVAKVETEAVEEMPNSAETARQPLDENAREGEKALAPVLGIGKDILKITADWNRKISAHLATHKVNPEGKTPDNQTTKVSFSLNRRGNVVSVDVIASSGDAAFDAAAVSMVRKSDPFPIPPAAVTEDRIERTVDIVFRPPEDKKKKKTAQRQ